MSKRPFSAPAKAGAGAPTPVGPARPRTVTVHSFRIWDVRRGCLIVPPAKATARRIKALGGAIVPDTAEQVPEAHIDGQGRHRPPPGRHRAG